MEVIEKIMILVVEILGILCMLTIMFVLIWGFILAKQTYSQIRYQNYLLEKLTQNVYLLVKKNNVLTDSLNNKKNINHCDNTSSKKEFNSENI